MNVFFKQRREHPLNAHLRQTSFMLRVKCERISTPALILGSISVASVYQTKKRNTEPIISQKRCRVDCFWCFCPCIAIFLSCIFVYTLSEALFSFYLMLKYKKTIKNYNIIAYPPAKSYVGQVFITIIYRYASSVNLYVLFHTTYPEVCILAGLSYSLLPIFSF